VNLSGRQMEELVGVINGVVERATLMRLVRYRLEVSFEDIVKAEQTKIEDVFQVIDWSIRRKKAEPLIEGLAKEYPNIAQKLHEIVDEAQRVEGVSPGAAAPAPDPLAPYFPRDVPFVDREDLTRLLDTLWTSDRPEVLVVFGDRYSGRSHSWLRIIDAAVARGVFLRKVDVSRDPGSWTIATFVDRVATLMRVDRQGLKDSLGQGSTQSVALVNALIRQAGAVAGGERWCLVFDGLDRPGVDPAILECVETLIDEVLGWNIPFLSIIVLGYSDRPGLKRISHLVLTERIRWLQEGDLLKWLDRVVRALGKVAGEADLAGVATTILAGHQPPFDAETMDLLRERVKSETVALLGRLP